LIKEQIKKDVDLLRKFGLMDYSLLFAIEKSSAPLSPRSG
jgi:hypothetical protein